MKSGKIVIGKINAWILDFTISVIDKAPNDSPGNEKKIIYIVKYQDLNRDILLLFKRGRRPVQKKINYEKNPL